MVSWWQLFCETVDVQKSFMGQQSDLLVNGIARALFGGAGDMQKLHINSLSVDLRELVQDSLKVTLIVHETLLLFSHVQYWDDIWASLSDGSFREQRQGWYIQGAGEPRLKYMWDEPQDTIRAIQVQYGRQTWTGIIGVVVGWRWRCEVWYGGQCGQTWWQSVDCTCNEYGDLTSLWPHFWQMDTQMVHRDSWWVPWLCNVIYQWAL